MLVLSPGHINGIACLEILPRDLNIVEPGVLEVDQVVTEKVKGLFTGLGIEKALVAVSPVLQSTQVLVMCQRSLQEVFFVLFLLEGRVRITMCDARITYPCE